MEAHVGHNALGVPLSAQCLAYLGDAVFELQVRTFLLAQGGRPVNALNSTARKYVSAAAQARMYHRIEPLLSEEEQAVLRRGRNLHPQTRSKNAELSDYRHATGLEALFGFLYAGGRHQRLAEIFALCVEPGGNSDEKR